MSTAIQGVTANEVWVQAFNQLLSGQELRGQSGRGGNTRELLHVTFSIENPRERWISARLPPINPAFAIAEVVWIVSGRRDAAFLNYFNRKLPQYAGPGSTYHGAYGYRMRTHFGLDQLNRAFSTLKLKPESRQVVLQIWDPRADLPNEEAIESSSDVPCNVCSLLKVRDGNLEWMQIMRSNDIFRGTPYNFIQFTSLQEIMSGWLGVGVGTYNQLSDSLHLYDTDLSVVGVDVAASSDAANSDSLACPKTESDQAFKELARRIEHLIADDLDSNELRHLAQCNRIPEAHQNLLRILVAEAARRRGLGAVSSEIVSDCTNPTLVLMWNRWVQALPPRYKA